MTRVVELPIGGPLFPDLNIIVSKGLGVVASTVDISARGDGVLTHEAQNQIEFINRMGLWGTPQPILDNPQ